MIFRKNNSLIVLGIIIATLITGCSSNGVEESNDTPVNIVEEMIENKEDNQEYVLVSDIEFVGAQIEEPNSIGTRYFKSQVKNNSNYTITGISVELELDNGETSYFSTHDTLLPGDTSSNASCFGATTGNLEDMKAKKINITMINDENRIVYVDYDVKLEKYDVIVGDKVESIESPVLVRDLEFINPTILEPNSIGTIYFETQIKNNSKSIITGISIELELDNGETAYLSTYDTLLSGDTSTKTSCFGPTTGNLEDMKAKKISITALDENKNKIYIDYDVKLKEYDVMKSVN